MTNQLSDSYDPDWYDVDNIAIDGLAEGLFNMLVEESEAYVTKEDPTGMAIFYKLLRNTLTKMQDEPDCEGHIKYVCLEIAEVARWEHSGTAMHIRNIISDLMNPYRHTASCKYHPSHNILEEYLGYFYSGATEDQDYYDFNRKNSKVEIANARRRSWLRGTLELIEHYYPELTEKPSLIQRVKRWFSRYL